MYQAQFVDSAGFLPEAKLSMAVYLGREEWPTADGDLAGS